MEKATEFGKAFATEVSKSGLSRERLMNLFQMRKGFTKETQTASKSTRKSIS